MKAAVEAQGFVLFATHPLSAVDFEAMKRACELSADAQKALKLFSNDLQQVGEMTDHDQHDAIDKVLGAELGTPSMTAMCGCEWMVCQHLVAHAAEIALQRDRPMETTMRDEAWKYSTKIKSGHPDYKQAEPRKKLNLTCNKFAATGTCKYGDGCCYQHVRPALLSEVVPEQNNTKTWVPEKPESPEAVFQTSGVSAALGLCGVAVNGPPGSADCSPGKGTLQRDGTQPVFFADEPQNGVCPEPESVNPHYNALPTLEEAQAFRNANRPTIQVCNACAPTLTQFEAECVREIDRLNASNCVLWGEIARLKMQGFHNQHAMKQHITDLQGKFQTLIKVNEAFVADVLKHRTVTSEPKVMDGSEGNTASADEKAK